MSRPPLVLTPSPVSGGCRGRRRVGLSSERPATVLGGARTRSLACRTTAVEAGDLCEPAVVGSECCPSSMPATTRGRSICFWHPVGPHTGESLDQIVARKQQDIERFGFTLWAFSPARVDRVQAWRRELEQRSITECDALCCGRNTVDPMRSDAVPIWARQHSTDQITWNPVPHPRMSSYHRVRPDGIVASAFYVIGIDVPDQAFVTPPETWLHVAIGDWATGRVPTRGEYLVLHPRSTSNGLRVMLRLRVAAPFVVWLR